MPFIAYVPGFTRAEAVSEQPVIGMDLYPTILDLAGSEVVENDGKNLLPLLNSQTDELSRTSLFWHYPHYHGSGMVPGAAMRSGKWKLVEWYEKSLLGESESALELYNLEEDISESVNLALRPPSLNLGLW